MSTNYDMVSIIFTFWKEIDTGNDRVQKFNSNGGFITKWGSGASGVGGIVVLIENSIPSTLSLLP
jgi:L-lactate utilization protein LutC